MPWRGFLVHSEPVIRSDSRRRIFSWAVLIASVWAAPRNVHAQSVDSGTHSGSPKAGRQSTMTDHGVSSVGSCPDAGQVWREIARLVGEEHLHIFEPPARIDVENLGDEYRVDVSGAARTGSRAFVDRSRTCEHRARFSAVFAVLTLMPPELELNAVGAASSEEDAEDEQHDHDATRETPSSQPRSASPKPVDRGSSAASAAQAELGATVRYWPGVSEVPTLVSYGIELRGAFGPWPVTPFAFASLVAKREIRLGSIEASLSRSTFGLGGRWNTRLGAIHVAIDAAGIAELQSVRGKNLVDATSDRGWVLGGRGEASVSSSAWPFGPFLGLNASFFPEPSNLVATPAGSLGSTAYFEIGLILGANLAL